MNAEASRSFKRELNALSGVSSFIHAFVASHNIDPTVQLQVDLAVDELVTNMIEHNPDGPGDIEIRLKKDDQNMTVILIDIVSEPFDLTQHNPADVNASLNEREIGGLGVHLVKQMMDEVHYEYEYEKTQSIITLIKKLTVPYA